ncbi:MAG: ABC transporter ATP-binding protein [Bacteroidota bacterium]
MSFIQISDVNKIYNGSQERVNALNGVSLEIQQGEFVAVMGHSGSGKSTLLSMLGGLSHPTSGTVIVDGIDVYSLNAEQRADFRREYVGFVFQSFQLIPYLTVQQNVLLPLVISGYSEAQQNELAQAVLEKVGLVQKRNRLPDQLSGGEQERVAIARALVNKPPLLLADEPTGNLDTATGEQIMKMFLTLNEEGQTIIMVTHNKENEKFAGRCITIRDGKVILAA